MKVDLHTHTRASPDSWIPPARLAIVAKNRGLDSVAITDHSTTAGWKEAKEGAKKAGIPLILGEDVGVKPTGRTVGEIIGLFMNEEVSGRGKTAVEVIDALKAQDAVIVLPHPFDRFRKVFPEEELREIAVKVDAVESFNAHVLLPEFNEKAEGFADEFGLPKCAGSDAHTSLEVGRAWNEAKAKDLEEFRKELLAGRISISGDYAYLIARLAPIFAKMKTKLFGKRKP